MTYPPPSRGSNKKVNELGEEVDSFVLETESKKRDIIKEYTAVASNGGQGVDILDDNGNYRNVYEIKKMSPYKVICMLSLRLSA